MRTVFCFLCAALFAVAACTDEGRSTPSLTVTETDSAGVSVVTISGDPAELVEWSLSEPVTEVSGGDPPFLGSVGEIEILADGRLLIEDNQTAELRLFDRSGGILRLLGGRGDGPGEFQNLTELSLGPGDTIVTYDRRLYRVSRFTPDGDLVSTISVGRERAGPGSLILDAWPLGADRIAIHSLGEGDNSRPDGPPYRDQRDAVVHSLDLDGVEVAPAIRFTGAYSIRGSHGDAAGIWSNEPFVSTASEVLLHGSGITYDLWVRDSELEPLRAIRWDGWLKPLLEATVQEVRDSSSAGMEELRATRPQLAEDLLAALFDPTLLPDSIPAIGTAFLDADRRIWVSRFRMRAERWDQEDVWHVLSPTGHPVARLRLPPDSRLAAVRDDLAAVVTRDDLDVEHVRVSRMVPVTGPQG